MARGESTLNKVLKLKMQTKVTILTNMLITTLKTQVLLVANLLVLSLENQIVRVYHLGILGSRGTCNNTIFIIRLLNKLELNLLRDKEASGKDLQLKSKVSQLLFKDIMFLKDIKTISVMKLKLQSGSEGLSIWSTYQPVHREGMEQRRINIKLQVVDTSNKKQWLQCGGVELIIKMYYLRYSFVNSN
jgi:hypothetical protein